MYYILTPDIIYYYSHFNQAIMEGGLLTFDPTWLDDIPFGDNLPPLIFSFNTKAPKLDNLRTRVDISLYSPKLINLIEQAQVRFETFPIVALDRKTKQPIETSYKAFHLLEVYPAIDQSRSIISEDGHIVEKLVLTEESLKAARPLFRDKDRGLVLIHKDLKATFDRAKITGCNYVPIENI